MLAIRQKELTHFGKIDANCNIKFKDKKKITGLIYRKTHLKY